MRSAWTSLSKIQKVLLVLFLFVVFLYCFNQLNNPDTFYDLRAGQLIWQTKQIPHADVFSFTALGAQWIPHEWLAQLIFYGVQAALGFWGLMAFVGILAVATYYLLFVIARRRGANFYVTLLALFALGIAGFSFWVPRPQCFVFLLCVALIYVLERYRTSPRPKYLYASILIVLVWANINASVALALGIIALFLAALTLKERRWSPPVKYLLCAFLASIGVSFINPSGYEIFTYGVTILPAIKAFHIYEWQPIATYWAGWDTKVFVVAIVASACFLAWRLCRKASRDMVWLVLVLGVAIMPFVAARYLIFWALIAAPPLAWTVSEMAGKRIDRIRPTSLVVGSFILLAAFGIARVTVVPHAAVDDAALPVHAADFLADNGAQGNAFNVYEQGGYLLWRLWPQAKIAMDGRSEVYLGAPTADYNAILRDAPTADQLISQKYDIQYFILPYDPAFLASVRPLLTYLAKNDWQLVWWDDGAIVLAKNDAQNSAMIKHYALHYTGPFIDPSTISAGDTAAASKELGYLLNRAPDSAAVTSYVSTFLASHPATGLSR